MKVSIIIPNYNGRDLLEKNLPKVLTASGYPQNQILEVIIVDDGSVDGSVEFIKSKYSDVRLIKHTKNRGFPAAVNTGVRSARGKLVCLLNTDVAPSRDFLVAALPHFKKKDVFAVSLHEAGYGWGKGQFTKGFVELSPGEESANTKETFWASGGTAVFLRALWISIGGMDEILFSPFYWEDIDLSYRAQKRGFKVLWEPGCKVVHEHEATVKKVGKRFVARIRQRNQLLFIWKNITSANLTKRHVSSLIKRLVGHPGYMVVVVSALGKWGAVKKARRKEKKDSKVSDEAVFAKFR